MELTGPLRYQLGVARKRILSFPIHQRHSRRGFLVYTMGKVGSSTIYRTLQQTLPFHKHIYHVHFLSDRWLDQILPSRDETFHPNIAHGRSVRSALMERTDLEWCIITLVRDPIARDVSDLLQNWPAWFGQRTVDEVSLDEVLAKYQAREHGYPEEWFETELKPFLGFDWLAHPFDRERGYTNYQTERGTILCLKLERLDEVVEEAFQTACGMPLALKHSVNRSEDKPGKRLYQAVKQVYKPTQEKLDRVYSSAYMQHFYTPNEIQAFKQRWS